jgi:hypothetical protein
VLRLFLNFLGTLRASFRSRTDLVLENLALRQQLANYPHASVRPHIRGADRAFWILLSRLWSRWTDALVVVKPDTVIRWHRAGFRLYWRWKSRARKPAEGDISPEVKKLIHALAMANATWGAPRSTAKCSNSASTTASALSPATFPDGHASLRPRPGAPFSTTTSARWQSICRTTCGIHTARLPRPRHRSRRAAPAPSPKILLQLLPSVANPSVSGQGRAGATTCPPAHHGRDRRVARDRRLAPSLRTPCSLNSPGVLRPAPGHEGRTLLGDRRAHIGQRCPRTAR